jgi:glutamate synthase domain-containing protein 3
MTNGLVFILGPTGKNFGAGMSGGLAYIYDEKGNFEKLYNPEMVETKALDGEEDEKFLQSYIYQHIEKTDSERAKAIMADWATAKTKFVKVVPKDSSVSAPKDEKPKPVAAK